MGLQDPSVQVVNLQSLPSTKNAFCNTQQWIFVWITANCPQCRPISCHRQVPGTPPLLSPCSGVQTTPRSLAAQFQPQLVKNHCSVATPRPHTHQLRVKVQSRFVGFPLRALGTQPPRAGEKATLLSRCAYNP